ncbi:porin family protein [Acinetobacter ursingii]|uniref:porin family protein n=1 Tax=Acinetobacter ursingii TaxID=108980 RepID=UPI0021CD4ED9|nr:porin family protein [Acinetobacter ursingii]MCU4589086.1 porin family protein [Acinetobacter ursingii]
MIKKYLLLTLGVLTTSVFANDWRQLPTNQNPPEMGEPTKAVQVSSSRYGDSNPQSVSGLYSITAGYMGSKIGSNDLGGDEKFNGLFINGDYNFYPNLSAWLEYAYQDASDMDFNQVSLGLKYKLYDDEKIYSSVSGGVGYAWLKESGYDSDYGINASLDLRYVTLPIAVEFGYKINPNISVLANVGYEWLFNQDSEACVNSYCASGSDSELDVDGVIYKLGLKYSF